MPARERLTMRERTRQAVRSQLTEVAIDLFLRDGYEATTVEQIAEAAGTSKRTLFRYFASKEDLVIGKYEVFGERLADALRSRPGDEPLWDALGHVFELTAAYAEDGPTRQRNDAVDRMIRDTPSLFAAYLERHSRAQGPLIAAARERFGDVPDAALEATVVVGAAFACLSAAHAQSPHDARSFPELLRAAMRVARPGTQEKPRRATPVARDRTRR